MRVAAVNKFTNTVDDIVIGEEDYIKIRQDGAPHHDFVPSDTATIGQIYDSKTKGFSDPPPQPAIKTNKELTESEIARRNYDMLSQLMVVGLTTQIK